MENQADVLEDKTGPIAVPGWLDMIRLQAMRNPTKKGGVDIRTDWAELD
jgi:hypothetical protein